MKNSLFLFLGLLLFSVTAFAQSSTGRLFFTPEERARLDAEKTSRVMPDETLPPAESALPERRYQGVMQRRHGSAVVWVDGEFSERATLPDWPVGEREQHQDLLRGGRVTVHPARQP